ncbi:MAG: 2-amino-4-hydroxy-6-hydroxymethyldihydropteridine diphosphokinase [Beijerinckiaceae bacterium]
MAETVVAALGLGANIGDSRTTLARALDEIEARGVGVVTAVSSLWKTPPWGVTDQPFFLNAVALVETSLSPEALLFELKRIETDLGRKQTVRWGPRAIDIDILTYGERSVHVPGLNIPHQSMWERAFVLAPLAEIAGDAMIAGRRVDEALASVNCAGIEILEKGGEWRRASGDRAMGEKIELTCRDGEKIGAYVARPTGAPRGGIVVLQEIFGVNHHIRAVADRFAAAGYLAVAPALFDRVERNVELGYGQDDRPRAMDLRGKTRVETTLQDIEAAIAVARQAGKVALVGYCWGGTLAFLGACRLSGLAASVGYYGGGIATIASERPRIPLMLHFGEHDKHIPLSDVEKIRSAQPTVPVFVYDADHGFNCDERESYNQAAAGEASLRTMEFLAAELK